MVFIKNSSVAYSLTGSIIEFSEAPRAGSDCTLFIYTGSNADALDK